MLPIFTSQRHLLLVLILLPGCASLSEHGLSTGERSPSGSPTGFSSLEVKPKSEEDPVRVERPVPIPVVGYSVSTKQIQKTSHRIHGPYAEEAASLTDTSRALLETFPLSSTMDRLPGNGGNADVVCTDIEQDLTCIERIFEDHKNYYSLQNLGFLSVGFGVGGVLANTRWDEDFSRHFNSSVQGASSDEWAESFHSPKDFGNGLLTLPLFAAAWGVGALYDDTTLGDFSSEWGERSLRAFLVGAPPVILMQKVTGGSRPEEGESHWHFWQDTNGVSGHSFMGSLPFLTGAQMVDDPFYKCLLYAGSTIVPISRVSDGDHYPSQAILGWWMAWSAATAIDATQDRDSQWRTMPLIGPGYSGINLEFRW